MRWTFLNRLSYYYQYFQVLKNIDKLFIINSYNKILLSYLTYYGSLWKVKKEYNAVQKNKDSKINVLKFVPMVVMALSLEHTIDSLFMVKD